MGNRWRQEKTLKVRDNRKIIIGRYLNLLRLSYLRFSLRRRGYTLGYQSVTKRLNHPVAFPCLMARVPTHIHAMQMPYPWVSRSDAYIPCHAYRTLGWYCGGTGGGGCCHCGGDGPFQYPLGALLPRAEALFHPLPCGIGLPTQPCCMGGLRARTRLGRRQRRMQQLRMARSIRPPTPQETPMTISLWPLIQDLISLAVEDPLHCPYSGMSAHWS